MLDYYLTLDKRGNTMNERNEEKSIVKHEEIMNARYSVIEKATQLRDNARKIRKELDEVIRVSNTIIYQADDSKHFPVRVHDMQEWYTIGEVTAELNGRIKLFRGLKRVYELFTDAD